MVSPNEDKLSVAEYIDAVGLIIFPETVNVTAIGHVNEGKAIHASIVPLGAINV